MFHGEDLNYNEELHREAGRNVYKKKKKTKKHRTKTKSLAFCFRNIFFFCVIVYQKGIKIIPQSLRSEIDSKSTNSITDTVDETMEKICKSRWILPHVKKKKNSSEVNQKLLLLHKKISKTTIRWFWYRRKKVCYCAN